jgi:O-6-methylguanine DNA methyltransferase
MADRTYRYTVVDTVLGPASIAGSSAGLCLVILPGLDKPELRALMEFKLPGAVEGERGLKIAAADLARFFETGRPPRPSIRLDLDGVGEFRKAVYDALREVPAGETVTYAELARSIGRPGAHRSVGTAVSRNPVPLFVPCHRVVRSDGSLAGFTPEGGIELKATMLALEGGR